MKHTKEAKEAISKAVKARWAKKTKEQRSEAMSHRAKGLWKKIRAGELSK